MMQTTVRVLLVAFFALAGAAAGQTSVVADLSGFNEVPSVISSGSGTFTATIDEDKTEISYHMEYRGLRGDALQSHIHVAQEGVNGSIVVFLCSNLGNGPAGTPSCPVNEGEVSGTWTVDSVIPATAQGIDDTSAALRRVIKAMLRGSAYVNLHSTRFPGGELRGQVEEDTGD